MSKIVKWVIGLVLVAAIGAVTWSLVGPKSDGQPGAQRTAAKGSFKGRGRGAADAVPVLVAPAEVADVPVYLEGLGTARALNTVTVQPMVDGRLVSVNFREGQQVKRGDLLGVIDPTSYQAQLDQALAKKAQDEAQLADARRELDRNTKLGPIATLQKNVDTARAKVAQFEALVKADQAAIDFAKAQLAHTRIVAPIDGRTGLRQVDEGNVVRASAASALVVITQIQPLAILFNLPQQQLGRVNAAMLAAGGLGEIAAEAMAADGKTVLDRGILRVIDNQVDQTTGTIRLKAEFPNDKLQLWPGQFANVRLLIETLRGVVAIPTAALQQGPNGPFVYVVSGEGIANVRPVKIAQQDERVTVVTDGVRAGEQVATTSFVRLRDGAAVNATPAQPAGGTDPQAVPPQKRPERRGPSTGPASGSGAEVQGQSEKGGEGKRRRREAEAAQGKAQTGTPGTAAQ